MNTFTRTSIIISISIASFVPSLHAQSLLDIGNEWIYEYNDYRIGGGNYQQTLETIRITKDSVINGKTYRQVSISKGAPSLIFSEVEFLREENGKLYRLNEGRSKELLMMDYEARTPYEMTFESKWLKKTFEVTVVYDSTGMETLADGNSIEVNYVHILNNLTTDDNAVFKFSKRLGYFDVYSLLFPGLGTGLADTGKDIKLRCHTNSSGTLHFVKDVNCTEINIINAISPPLSDNVLLYPNPVVDYFVLSSEYTLVQILDAAGQNMKYTIEGDKINISDLTSGLYFLKIRNHRTGLIQYIKLIKN